MQRIFKAISSWLFLSFLLVSCGSVTRVPTVTIVPQRTSAPINTNLPELPVTATLSHVEKLFPLPTRNYIWVNTPTPIATPNNHVSSAKLKEISEEDALNLVLEMNEYSYRNYPSHGDWWTDGFFVSSQRPVALAIQEYLYRYPQGFDAYRLRWQLAFIHAITSGYLSGNQYGDSWIVEELEKRLNHGETTPNKLESILGRYWFDVTYLQPVENLFNDGKLGWLYTIVPQVWIDGEVTKNQNYFGNGELFIAVREVQSNEYQILLLKSAWNFSFGESSIFEISDHNQNGKPEVALQIGSHSGTMCTGSLLIYEWHEDGFEELTKNKVSLNDCSEDVQYSKLTETPSIIYSGVFPNRTDVYKWNGEYYEFDRSADLYSSQLWELSIDRSRFTYADESEFLKKILNSGEGTKFGIAFPDYLRYRLGVALAFQSRFEEAVKEFQQLVSSPIDKTRNVFPDMASKFIELYGGEKDMYNACRQAREIYEKVLSPYRDSNGNVESEKLEQVLGFTYDGIYYDHYDHFLCNEPDAFSLLIESIPSSVDDLPFELKKSGVKIDHIQKVDANLDGKGEEWFVVFDTYDYFLVFSEGPGFASESLDTSLRYDKTSFQLNIDSWNSVENPVMTIFSDNELSILEVYENYESRNLLSEFGVKEYWVTSLDPIPQIELLYNKPKSEWFFPDHPWDGYRWDENTGRFNNDLIEYQLFILNDPNRAVEVVEDLLPQLDEWKNIENAWGLLHRKVSN